MIESLRFVQGVVKKNKISPELEHYRISDGRVSGFNGHMALSAPIDLDFEAYPNAKLFYQAIAACKDKTALYLTKANRLAIKSGGFRAYIPCLEDAAHRVGPEGEEHEVPEGLMESIKELGPFISEDASRPWSMGLLFSRGSMIATNNVVLVQKWTGHAFPEVNIPRFAINEMIRINEDPIKASVTDNNITFHYSDGRWLRTQLFSQAWPFDKLEKILSAECSPEPIQAGFKEAVNTLTPFFEEKGSAVYFGDGEISTSTAEEDGFSIAVEGLPSGPIFSIKQLQLIAEIAKDVDWSLYPNPCIFFGENIRGALVGMMPR